ncbi:MAG TPA: hypothetical protein VGR09_09910 [Gemmatimonadales bacterium]|nr:hypothetical protein [Gemmatimonadales bacterium]
MLRLDLLVLALTLAVPVTLSAQAAADSGSFIVRHAGDTVALERFSRTGIKLEGTLALRNPKKTSEHYSAVIAPDATLPLIEVTVRQGADSGPVKAKIVQRARVIFKEDSAAVDEVSDAGLVTRVFGTEEGAIPYLNLSFALLEQAVRRGRITRGASHLALFNLGGGQTLSARMSPLGGDSLQLDIGDIRFHLRVDGKGRVLGGRIPSQNLVVERR